MSLVDKREIFGEDTQKQSLVKTSEIFKPTLTTAIQESTARPISIPKLKPETGIFKSIKDIFGLSKPRELTELISESEAELTKSREEGELLAGFTRVTPLDREIRNRETVRRGANIIRTRSLEGKIESLKEKLPRPAPGDNLPTSAIFLERGVEEAIRPRRFMEGTALQNVSDELQRVVGRGVAGVTGGISDLLIEAVTGREPIRPVTIPGTVAGAATELGGFLTGPLQLSRALIAGRVSISGVSNFRQMANLVAKGAAELGLAGGLAEAAPSFVRSDSFTNMGIDILNSAAITSVIGGVFPISSLIPTKPLRVATMLAVMDLIRAPEGTISTVDDVVKGIADGSIDKKELAERSFGYIIDIYFSLKVPAKRALLKTFENNRLVKEALDLDVNRVEKDVAFINKNLSESLFEKGEVTAEKTPVDFALAGLDRFGVPQLPKGYMFVERFPGAELTKIRERLETDLLNVEILNVKGLVDPERDIQLISVDEARMRREGQGGTFEKAIDSAMKNSKTFTENIGVLRRSLERFENLQKDFPEIEQAAKDIKPIIGVREVHTAADGTVREGVDPEGHTTRTIKSHPADGVLKQVGDQVILDKMEPKDIAAFAEWIMSPEFSLRDRPEAQRLSSKIIEGELTGSFNISKDIAFFNESKHTISKEQQRKVTDHLRRIMDGKKGLELNEVEGKAADSIREWFDSVKEDIKIHKRAMYKRYLPDNEVKAFLETVKGGDVSAVLGRNKVTPERLLDLVNEYNSIDKWGLDDYITNMERGSYKMINQEGTVVLVGVTRKDAVDKAIVYLRANPTVKTLQLDTSAPAEAGLATELSRGQYFAIRGRLEEAMKSDINFINKEIASVAAREGLKGLLVIKPSFKFSGPLIRRKGILGGEDNIYDILPAYSGAVRKKIALDPVIADVRSELHKFPPNIRDLLISQMEYAKGRYAFGDKAVDNLTGKLGMKPMLWTRFVQSTRGVEANLKLGYRPVASFVNLVAGQGHTFTKIGFKYLTEAHKFIKTEEGKKFIVQEEAYLGMDFAVDVEGSVSTRQNWYNPLFLFQKPEIINRETSLSGNYLFAKGELGMTDIAAREFARRSVRLQQFTYNVAALPRMLRSPSGKLVGQFKTYLVKEIEFVSQLRGIEIARYVGMNLALGGPRAVVYMMRSLPIIGAYIGWDKIEEMLDKTIPRISRGVPGLVGTDITAPAVIQLPNEPADWGGPFLSDLHGLVSEVLIPVMEGEDFITENAIEWAKNLAPIANYWDKLLDSVMDADGWIRDRFGRKVYQVSNWYDKLLLTIGAPPIELARQTAMLRVIAKEEEILSRNQRKVTRRIIRSLMDESGRGDINSDDIDDLIRYQVTGSMIESTIKSMELSAKQRSILRTRKSKKLRVFELLNQ